MLTQGLIARLFSGLVYCCVNEVHDASRIGNMATPYGSGQAACGWRCCRYRHGVPIHILDFLSGHSFGRSRSHINPHTHLSI